MVGLIKKTQSIILIISFFCLPFFYISGATLKKVILLDFKNILNEKGFEYLEPTITDAVRKKLQEKFAYQELTKEQWQKVATDNFIREEELYTYTAANRLGVLAKQDVAIFGGYYIEKSKKKKSKLKIVTRVRIVDIAKRLEVADFKIKSVADSTIFKSVAKIADRIIKEASAVLPSKEAFEKGDIVEEVSKSKEISIFTGYSAVSLSDQSRSLSQGSEHSISDFNHLLNFGFSFQQLGLLKNNLGFRVGANLNLANDTFSYQLDGNSVPAELLGVSSWAGITYRYLLTAKLYLQPVIGAGYQYNILKFTHANQTVSANSATGQTLSATELSSQAPFGLFATSLGYQLNHWLNIELGYTINYSFYSSANKLGGFVQLGLGFVL